MALPSMTADPTFKVASGFGNARHSGRPLATRSDFVSVASRTARGFIGGFAMLPPSPETCISRRPFVQIRFVAIVTGEVRPKKY